MTIAVDEALAARLMLVSVSPPTFPGLVPPEARAQSPQHGSAVVHMNSLHSLRPGPGSGCRDQTESCTIGRGSGAMRRRCLRWRRRAPGQVLQDQDLVRHSKVHISMTYSSTCPDALSGQYLSGGTRDSMFPFEASLRLFRKDDAVKKGRSHLGTDATQTGQSTTTQ